MLLKIKNVVKLQAAVRRHLVRSHAVGTLRCVQAIVKMQALVRARRSRLTLEGSYPESKLGGKLEKDNDSSKTWVMLLESYNVFLKFEPYMVDLEISFLFWYSCSYWFDNRL